MSSAGTVTVRHARAGDAAALGLLHVRAWQAAYRGQMPDGYLDGLRPEERAAGWERTLGRDRTHDPVLVAERDGAERTAEVLGVVVAEVRYRRRLERG
jgi:hypothetical protein